MRSKTAKRLLIAFILLFCVLAAYVMGFLHRAAYRAARAADITWGESAPQTIHIYYPRWACGEAQPPYLLIDTDSADSAHLAGRHIRVTAKGGDTGIEEIEQGARHFGECRGRFKYDLAMLVWEHELMRLDGWCDGENAVTGHFFEAQHCEPARPDLEQTLKIEEFMRPHLE